MNACQSKQNQYENTNKNAIHSTSKNGNQKKGRKQISRLKIYLYDSFRIFGKNSVQHSLIGISLLGFISVPSPKALVYNASLIVLFFKSLA